MDNTNILNAILITIAETEKIVMGMAEPLDMLDELKEKHPELNNCELFQRIMQKRNDAILYIQASTKFLQQETEKVKQGNTQAIEELELENEDDISLN